MSQPSSILTRLMEVIEDRRTHRPAKSYTTELLDGGVDRIASKIREEADEVAQAAAEVGDEGRAHLVREVADLMYHMLVMLACRDAAWDDVEGELARRFGISGVEEKASRRSSGAGDAP